MKSAVHGDERVAFEMTVDAARQRITGQRSLDERLRQIDAMGREVAPSPRAR